MSISSNLIGTWNLKFKNKNNKWQYIGNKMQAECKWRVPIQRKMMKDVKYRNHI
jgi:hypothetical protein